MQVYDVNRSLADRLHSAAIHLLRRLRRHDAAMGLSAARASALSVIVFGGPVTIGHLARAEQVSAPTITRLVLAMERDGLDGRDAEHDGSACSHASPRPAIAAAKRQRQFALRVPAFAKATAGPP